MIVQSLRSCPWGLESLAICTLCHKGLQAFCKFGKFKKFWASQVALMVKNPPAKARDTRDAGLIPGLGGFPRERYGNPLQYPFLENPMDRGAWLATVHRVTKSRLKGLSTPQRSMDSHPFFASWSPLGFPLFKFGFSSPFLLQWISQKIFQNSSHNYHGTTVTSLQFPRAQHRLVLKTAVYWPSAT